MTELARVLLDQLEPADLDRLADLVAERAAADELAALVTVPALLSVASTAQLLDCSPRTIRRRIAEGTLPAVIDNDRIMVRADELRDHIERLERVGAPPPRRRTGRAGGGYDFLRD